MASRATIHRPGEPPEELSLPPGATAEVLPSVRVSAAEAPGLVLEGSPRRIRVGHRALRRGERWLLRPGQSATVDGARIEAGWDDPGTAAEARSVLLSALHRELPVVGTELVALAGPLAGRRLRARPGVLGRGPDAATRVDDPSVSRVHARLLLEGRRVLLEDLGSKNGSWVAGNRVEGLREIRPGDELRAGQTVLALTIAAAAPPSTDPPAPQRSPLPAPGGGRRAALLLAAVAAATAAVLLLQGTGG